MGCWDGYSRAVVGYVWVGGGLSIGWFEGSWIIDHRSSLGGRISVTVGCRLFLRREVIRLGWNVGSLKFGYGVWDGWMGFARCCADMEEEVRPVDVVEGYGARRNTYQIFLDLRLHD